MQLGMPMNFVWNFDFCIGKYQQCDSIKVWEYICQHSGIGSEILYQWEFPTEKYC